MLLFKNRQSGNYFAVDNKRSKVEFLPDPAVRIFRIFTRYSHYLGNLEFLELPDTDTVKQFRKIVEKGALKNVDINDTRAFILQNYPEYFI